MGESMGEAVATDFSQKPSAYIYPADAQAKQPERNTFSRTSTWHSWIRARPRVVALHLDSSGSFGPATEYQSSVGLQTHLDHRNLSNTTSQRSIYLLEGLSPEFTEVLGSHFRLPPSIFQDHERLIAFHKRATGESGGIPFLPSAIHGRSYVSLKYHEPLSLSVVPTGFRNLCEVSGRHIAVTKIMGSFCEDVILRRKCTFWSRKLATGGWDCESYLR